MSRLAHLVFSEEGFILPADTPYERELVIEHAIGLVHAKRNVQITIGSKRWIVTLVDMQCPMGECSSCQKPINDIICRLRQSLGSRYCIICALG